MKRTMIYLLAMLAAATTAKGQTIYDAIAFSENNYYGTAHTQAMGNAVTALGGDLGSIVINPAGSAVAGYSQFSLTPGLSISSSNSSFAPVYGEGYQGDFRSNKVIFTFPEFGASFRFDTGRNEGLKSFTLSLLVSGTNQHLFSAEAAGDNSRTSISASFAAIANLDADGMGNMMDPNVFKNYKNPYTDSYYGWNQLSAYESNMISYNSAENAYYGVAESLDGRIAGTLRQVSQRQASGSKNDVIANFGFNFSDKLYIGFNIGIPTQRYSYLETFREVPLDSEQFPVEFITQDIGKVRTCFKGLAYKYSYDASLDGIYGKMGVIWRPVNGLRLGASIQTPTAVTISETYRTVSGTEFADSRFSSEGTSPLGSYRYRMRSPFSASFGAAYVFGTAGLVSIDYELMDFSGMRYSELNYDKVLLKDPFEILNKSMNLFCGVSSQLRVGAELRCTPNFILRAGYVLKTNPEKHYTNNRGETVWASDFEIQYEEYQSCKLVLSNPQYDFSRSQHTFSAGLGYDSGGAFYADASFRCRCYPGDNFATYSQYYSDLPSPDVATKRRLFDVALTLGVRF